jgi:hypothetical protein
MPTKEGKLAQVDTIPFVIRTGNRIRICKDRLRAQFLPKDRVCSYVRVIADSYLSGNVFACRWTCNNKSVCWITQLVVHRDYRERRLAVGLLDELKENDDDICGLVSSPSCCLRSRCKSIWKCTARFAANPALTICRYH